MPRSISKQSVFGAIVIGAAMAMPMAAFAASGAPASAATTTQPTTQPSVGNAAAYMPSSKREAPEISRVQEALNKDGASVRVDGKIGPKTRMAIEAFQQKHNLGATGKLDESTETALKLR